MLDSREIEMERGGDGTLVESTWKAGGCQRDDGSGP